MENPLAKLVPQYFGEYPKSFQRLFSKQIDRISNLKLIICFTSMCVNEFYL